jgi:hypothetical protein
MAGGLAARGFIVDRRDDPELTYACGSIENAGTGGDVDLHQGARCRMAQSAGLGVLIDLFVVAREGGKHDPSLFIKDADPVDALFLRDRGHDFVDPGTVIGAHGLPRGTGYAFGKLVGAKDHRAEELPFLGLHINKARYSLNDDDDNREGENQTESDPAWQEIHGVEPPCAKDIQQKDTANLAELQGLAEPPPCAERVLNHGILSRTILDSEGEVDMHGQLYALLEGDHRQLEIFLHGCIRNDGTVDIGIFDKFRSGILRHIFIEERVLLPALTGARGGTPLKIAERLRLDHGAVAALLVPSPTRAIVKTLVTIFASHNPLEEGPGGFYDAADALGPDDVAGLMDRIRGVRPVPVQPYNDKPGILDATRRALARAGYSLASPD